jgi:hypothetical protein
VAETAVSGVIMKNSYVKDVEKEEENYGLRRKCMPSLT